MSSRRGGSKSKSSAAANAAQKAKNLPAHSAPPSHPIENMREHRAFLARSLSRNDADLAAIVDLNRTLHKVKQNIIDACGEELLLDLGEGLLELTPCGRDLMVALPKSESLEKWKKRKADVEAKIPIFDDHRRLCVDFLLRIKLRRRLLNRFVRRLNRLAHAMDGNDVSPPALPSYGDLRLHLDPSEVKDYESHRKLQEQARDRIEAYRREHPDSLLPLLEVKKEEEEGEKAKKEEGEKSKEDEGNSKKEEEEDKKETGSEDKEDSEEEKTGTEREKSKTATEEDDEDSEDDSESEAKKQEKQEDKASENDKMEVDEEAKDKKTKMEDKKDEAPASAEKQTTNKQDFSAPQPDEKVETNEDVEMKDATKTEDEDETKDDDSSSSDDMFATSDKESEKEGDEKEKDACSPESTKATISSEEVGTEKVTKDEKDAKEPQKEAAADNKAASESTTKSKPEEGMNTPTKQEIAVDTKKEAAADALMTMFSSPSSAPTTPKEESAVPSAKSTEEAITKSEETPKEQEKETANEEMKGEEKADTKTTKEASSKPIEESAAVSVTGTAFADTKDAQEKTSDETKMDFDVAAKTDRMEVEKTVGDDSEPDKPEEEKAAEGPSKAEGGQRDESKSAEEKAKPEAADNETKEEDKDKEAASTAPQGPDERPSTAVKDETQSVADVKMEGTQEESKVPETQTQLAPKPDQPQSTPVKKEPEKAKASTPKKEPLIEMPPLREMNQLEKDCEILKDFVDAYEREIDPMTGEISYRINEVENRKEDFELLQSGPGIGATGRNLSMKEKEVEFHRWQAAVLAKIPEAPTFEELGMKNCVFKLEERRKRLRLEKENEQQGNKKRKLSDASSPMKKSKEDKPRNIGAVERKSPKKDAEAEKQEETVTKKVKPLSLVPLPSFHDSDLTRIRKIHNDLMFSSMFTASKKRVDDLTDEYNKGMCFTCLGRFNFFLFHRSKAP